MTLDMEHFQLVYMHRQQCARKYHLKSNRLTRSVHLSTHNFSINLPDTTATTNVTTNANKFRFIVLNIFELSLDSIWRTKRYYCNWSTHFIAKQLSELWSSPDHIAMYAIRLNPVLRFEHFTICFQFRSSIN